MLGDWGDPHSSLAGWARPLLADPRCEVAGAAASIVAREDPSVVPYRPRTRDASTLMRALCMFAHGSWGGAAAIAASFAPVAGIEILQPDGEAFEAVRSPIVRRVIPGRLVTRKGAETTWTADELEDELRRLGKTPCSGVVCSEYGARIEVELQPDRRGDLAIVRLRRPRDFGAERVSTQTARHCGLVD